MQTLSYLAVYDLGFTARSRRAASVTRISHDISSYPTFRRIPPPGLSSVPVMLVHGKPDGLEIAQPPLL
jgi:hypothetical protein